MKNKALYSLFFFIFISQALQAQFFKHIGMQEKLPQLSVLSIYQDTLGRMWFGTREGVGVYDGKQMTTYKPWSIEGWQNSKHVFTGNEINMITGNKEGDVFMLAEGALIRFDIDKEAFKQICSSSVSAIISYRGEIWCNRHDSIFNYDALSDSLVFHKKTGLSNISCLLITGKKVWIGTRSGLYVIEDDSIKKVLSGIEIFRLFESSKNEIWIASRMDGLYRIGRNGALVKAPYNPLADDCVVSNQIRGFAEDNNGNIWFGTFDGVQVYNPYTDSYRVYRQENKAGSLAHSSVFSLYNDRQGTIWIGTYYGGVNYLNPEKDIFSYYICDIHRDDCLNFPLVGPIIEDKDHFLWIGTDGGGVNRLDRKTNKFTYYKSGNSNSLPHNNVKSICYDKQRDCLYIGTYIGGLSRYDRETGKFYNYLDDFKKGGKGPNNVIYQVMFKNDRLYVSARNGFFVMNPDTGEFRLIDKGDYYQSFEIDSNGNAWLSTGRYLYRISLNRVGAKRERFPLLQPNLTYKVSKIMESKAGTIYIGTLGFGFFTYDPKNEKLDHYTVETNNLLSNYCYNLIETSTNHILVTGDEGITLFSPFTKESRSLELNMGGTTFPITDGCGIFMAENDEIFVGGSEGMIAFREKNLDIVDEGDGLYFSDLYIHNTKVYPEDVTGVLAETLPFTRTIELEPSQNNMIIHFSNSNYVSILENTWYEYRLEGFDKDWIPTTRTNLHYTNIPPGTYTLKVREMGNTLNVSLPREISLGIVVHRPWYSTWWAWIVYVCLVSALIYWQWNVRMSKKILALNLEQEKKEKERIEELNQVKLRFFTNISHEFRTPLTLIIGQIETLVQSYKLSPVLHNRISKIHKNAMHMRTLISELLDFRKQEQGFMHLKIEKLNIISFVEDIYNSFFDYSQRRHVTFTFEHADQELEVWFDPVQLHKVVYNLLSNAFKYTPQPDGCIRVTVRSVDGNMEMVIADTGQGIPEDLIHKIFDRFYQVDNITSGLTLGTGIGLALTKGIVEAHHGEIRVESQSGKGTIFTVSLPLGKEHFSEEELIGGNPANGLPVESIHELPVNLGGNSEEDECIETSDNKPVMLIIDDNEEILELLQEIFLPIYMVHRATNGLEGFELVRQIQPDIVLSDVMMPCMSGKELCYKIKNCVDISHIPVVLLTAQTSTEHTIEGFMFGADDYITKPFNVKLLVSRCNNLIKNRKALKEKFNMSGKPATDTPASIEAVNAIDRKLLDKAVEVIRTNFDNPDFDMEFLASELCMGKSKLYTRIKEVTGLTPNEFTLKLKLEEAVNLLLNESQYNIADISYRLGFTSPRYFSRCFKTFYNETPQNYRKMMKEG